MPIVKKVPPKLRFVLPPRIINWRAVREMIIYDMGGQAGWQPWIQCLKCILK